MSMASATWVNDYTFWDDTDVITTTANEDADDDPYDLTLDELNYLVRCGKKDKKLAGILRRLTADCVIEVGF
jgi:hypothetical protein